MANGRFLSKSISLNQQLARVSLEADYLFARCIPHLDIEGRMPGHPSLVKSLACPLRDEITEADIPRLLVELASAKVDDEGLVRWYESSGVQVLEFPGFHRHQQGLRKNREAASKLPAFSRHATDLVEVYAQQSVTAALRSNSGVTPDLLRTNSGPTPDLLRSNSGLTPAQVEVEVEVEGEVEVEVEEIETPTLQPPTSAQSPRARERTRTPTRSRTRMRDTRESDGAEQQPPRDDEGQQQQRERQNDEPENREAVISGIIRMANAGMRDNELLADFRPIMTNGDGRQVVADWLDEGISPQSIEVAVYHAAKDFTPSIEWPQIKKMSYFDAAVRRQHERDMALLTPAPKGTPAGKLPPDSEAARIKASVPRDSDGREVYEPKPGKRAGRMSTIGDEERAAHEQAALEQRLIAAWIEKNPDEAEAIMLQVKAWLEDRPEWQGERRRFAGPVVRSEFHQRVWRRIKAEQEEGSSDDTDEPQDEPATAAAAVTEGG